jgi:20S proteasome subunit beta 7
VNESCMVGASGELSDFQELQTYLTQLAEEDYMADDGIVYTPKEVHAYLCRVMYNRRSKCESACCSMVHPAPHQLLMFSFLQL